jgi:hypothetical protein
MWRVPINPLGHAVSEMSSRGMVMLARGAKADMVGRVRRDRRKREVRRER